MKKLTKYQANDGTLFDSETDAHERDALMLRCESVAAMLPPSPDRSNVRLKHNPQTLRAYRRAVIDICRDLFPSEPVFRHEPEEIHPFSWAGRFLSEAAPKCLYHLWWRLSCCDDEGYEYEQPFYAAHVSEFLNQKATVTR